MALTQAQAQYIDWLRKKDPFLLDVAIKRITGKNVAPSLEGISDIFSTIKNVDFSKLAASIADTANKLATAKSQVSVIAAQTKRAVNGQPPIDMTYYPMAANYSPESAQGQYSVNVAAQRLSQGSAFSGLLPVLALGVGGLLIFTLITRKSAA